jgi:hypothetical protein
VLLHRNHYFALAGPRPEFKFYQLPCLNVQPWPKNPNNVAGLWNRHAKCGGHSEIIFPDFEHEGAVGARLEFFGLVSGIQPENWRLFIEL